MQATLFCNIGWMNRYEGLANKPDKIVGGGKYVVENKSGHEVCNFLACRDGNVYGHVETIHGKKDRRIRIEGLGGSGEYVDGVDVVWTATDPENGGRRVVGWYRGATVFRDRQNFPRPPSGQHARDRIDSYRIRASAKNMIRLDLEDRTLAMGRGPGWMGRTPWWAPPNETQVAVREFVQRSRDLMNRLPSPQASRPHGKEPPRNSPGAASDPYLRYVEAYEVHVTPRHSALQERFEHFIATEGATELRRNLANVDFRYRDAKNRTILVEIKPCERANIRFAIRTAIGQLLDYRQRANEHAGLLIVVERKPIEEDRVLATSNGFGIAYPYKGKFKLIWSTRLRRDGRALTVQK
jgi:hypothetical protein